MWRESKDSLITAASPKVESLRRVEVVAKRAFLTTVFIEED
jgi:hypothetical protein